MLKSTKEMVPRTCDIAREMEKNEYMKTEAKEVGLVSTHGHTDHNASDKESRHSHRYGKIFMAHPGMHSWVIRLSEMHI